VAAAPAATAAAEEEEDTFGDRFRNRQELFNSFQSRTPSGKPVEEAEEPQR